MLRSAKGDVLILGTMITDLGVAPDFRAGPDRGGLEGALEMLEELTFC